MSKKKTRSKQESSLFLTDHDVYLFNEGTHFRLFDHLGAHPSTVDGECGTFFSVWAPNAEQVSVVGDFNKWDGSAHPLEPRASSGVWQGFIPGDRQGFHLQVPHRLTIQRLQREQGGSHCLSCRNLSQDRLHRLAPRLRVGRRSTGWQKRKEKNERPGSDIHLRSSSRFLASRSRRRKSFAQLS